MDLGNVLSGSDGNTASGESEGAVDMVLSDPDSPSEPEADDSSVFAFSSLNSVQADQVLYDSGAQQSVVPLSWLTPRPQHHSNTVNHNR